MPKIKRLDLPDWFLYQLKYPAKNPEFDIPLKLTSPIVGKDGWYFTKQAYLPNGKAWFEFQGKAYSHSSPNDLRGLKAVEDFLMELEILDVRLLRDKEYNALLILEKENLLSAKQKKLLQTNRFIKELRQTYRQCAKGVRKRFEQFTRQLAQKNLDSQATL